MIRDLSRVFLVIGNASPSQGAADILQAGFATPASAGRSEEKLN